MLQVSRTAVWKVISQLKEEGYEIEAVKNRGYRIVSSPDIMTEEEIGSRLHTAEMGQSCVCFEETDSTNTRAKQLAEEGMPHGTLVCAERHLPWGADVAYSYADTSEEGVPDLSLRYAYHSREGAYEEVLPDPNIEEGELLSEGQLFYLATGYALPRDQAPSSCLKGWFMEQGVPEGRAEALAWGAWFAS